MKPILALDPGHKLGYAISDPSAPNGVRTGLQRLPEGPWGRAFVSLVEWFELMIPRYRIKVIAWEMQLTFASPGLEGRTNLDSLGFLHGVCAVADFVATRRGLESWQVASSTARRHFTGDGSGKDAKVRVLNHARSLGYEVANFEAGDALAIYAFIAYRYRTIGCGSAA